MDPNWMGSIISAEQSAPVSHDQQESEYLNQETEDAFPFEQEDKMETSSLPEERAQSAKDLQSPSGHRSTSLPNQSVNFDPDSVINLLPTRNWLGESPLHDACRRGNVELMRLLMKRGDDVNALSPLGGRTPLMQAAGNGFLECVQALLEDPNIRTDTVDSWGHTAGCRALHAFSEETLNLLIANGVTMDQATATCPYVKRDSRRRTMPATTLTDIYEAWGVTVTSRRAPIKRYSVPDAKNLRHYDPTDVPSNHANEACIPEIQSEHDESCS